MIKKLKNIQKEDVWLGCMTVGPIMAYLAVFNTSLTIIAIIITLIGIKGTFFHIM